MTQYRVIFEEAADGEKPKHLNMRLAGNGSAAIVAGLRPRAIVHVTGQANAAGYGEASVYGWLGKDDRTVYSDSHSVADSSIDAVLYVRSAFEAQGEPDVYGRQPGVVRGWVYLPYLEPAQETRACPACGVVVELTGEGRYAGHDTPAGVICEMSGEEPE